MTFSTGASAFRIDERNGLFRRPGEGVIMAEVKSVAGWMAQRGVELTELIVRANLDDRVVKAIVAGQFTPSPEQRTRLANALGVEVAQIAWGHTVPVEHVYGHGPQFGRNP